MPSTGTSRVARYVARHHLGLIALAIALTGTATAATTLPRNSVGSVQIRDGSVKARDLATPVQAALRLKGVPGPAGAPGSPGARGETGPAGSDATFAGSAAGGDLTGTYPAPRLAAAEPTHVVGAPGEPAFGTTPTVWRAYGAGFGAPSFFRDRSGVVHLSGLACTQGPGGGCYTGNWTIDSTLFTLPPGYRPAARLLFTQTSYGSSTYHRTRVDVTADGDVVLIANNPDPIGGSFLTLDGISFRAGP